MLEFHLTLDQNLQAAFPPNLCDALEVKAGDAIMVMGDRHAMRLYRSPDLARRAQAVQKLQKIFSDTSNSATSVVDDFLAERRSEASRENSEFKPH